MLPRARAHASAGARGQAVIPHQEVLKYRLILLQWEGPSNGGRPPTGDLLKEGQDEGPFHRAHHGLGPNKGSIIDPLKEGQKEGPG